VKQERDPDRKFGPNPCRHGGYQVFCRECDQEEIDRALIEQQRPDLGAKGA
jgi:hypothetical protein